MLGNPFSESEHKTLRPGPTAMVIFGASGDLTKRKLVPALYNLARDNYLPTPFVVIGAARTKFSHAEFRANLKEASDKFSRRAPEEASWKVFEQQVYYHALDGSRPEDFVALKNFITDLERQQQVQFNLLYYLATAPEHFAQICTNLKTAGLVEDANSEQRRSRVVIEKPFGYDFDSAIQLNNVIRQSFSENQIFRIDHYLGKETVQNILVFRFANGMFEPLWNNRYIDHIQISVCESIGLENRAAYFDSAGILRDIVQNHLLQMLALLCIEPPIALTDSQSIRDEKAKVLKSLKPLSAADVARRVVRGQYSAGFVQGLPVSGYLNEQQISNNSTTETYVAMCLELDNWRWAGVPIFIRAGKRLAKRITEISIYFKKPPRSLFHERHTVRLEHDVLAIQVQPNEGITLRINAKPPGPRMRVKPVELDFTYGDTYGVASPEAYERLVLDAMKGDATLFTRDDEIQHCWSYLMPVLERWQNDKKVGLLDYAAGTWGPEEANFLIESYQRSWRHL